MSSSSIAISRLRNSATWKHRSTARSSIALSLSSIFSRARARTREGQMQVELAQLNYLLPRLAGRGIQMSRLGGGIGTRGPGETQLEMDRRRILQRISRVKGDLESVRAGRGIQRRQRQSVPLATIGARWLHERRQVDIIQQAHRARA